MEKKTMENNNVNYCQLGKIIAVCFQDTNYEDKVELQLGNNYEIKEENGKYYAIKKKLKYPNNYKECCEIMGFCSDILKWSNPFCINRDTHPYIKHFDNLIENFCKLFICRAAYYKIAGEEMGLGKHWEPDWSTEGDIKYVIEIYRNNIRKNSQGYSNTLLAFPTTEMRDAFYENFKDLIEECKELL